MILFLFFHIAMAATPTWNQLHSTDGWRLYNTVQNSVGTVEVWTKEIEGIPCFYGKTESKVNVDTLLGIAKDIEGSLKWSSAGLKESVTLRKTAREMDYYQRMSIPLLSSRHWFLRGKTSRSKNETLFYWDRLVDGGPHSEFYQRKMASNPKAVEPPVNVGGWSFVPHSEGVTVRYYICTHPGGSVPQRIQAIGTAKTLPNNLRDLIIEGQNRVE